MKLTKLHIFLILLFALILCSYYGMCSIKEGYTSSTYGNYGKYYSNLNDSEVSATNWSQGLDDKYNNPYYDKDDEFHKRYGGKYKNPLNDNDNDYSYQDDLNGDGKNNSSNYMFSSSYKKNKNYDMYGDDDNNIRGRRNTIFDSVSSGAINGSMFSKSNNNNNNQNNSNNNSNTNNTDTNNTDNTNNNEGVKRDQIPKGQEDLYILKSQALTPICPACPAPPKVDCNDKCGKSKCPPCPPCARCPEPQFDCVKVPNYNTTSMNQNLPIPWMAKL
jgi:hypothetical protein